MRQQTWVVGEKHNGMWREVDRLAGPGAQILALDKVFSSLSDCKVFTADQWKALMAKEAAEDKRIAK